MKFMKKELLAAVAATALIVTVGAVHAQTQQGPNQPGEAGEKVGAQPGGPGNRAPGQAQQPGASGTGMKKQTTQSGQNQPGEAGEKVGAQPGGPGNRAPGQAESSGEMKSNTQAQSGSDKPAQLSSEQRTKLSSTIRQKDVNLKRVDRTKINFNINVGTVVPRSFDLVPLPAPIVSVVPAYRGYLYIVVGNDLLIVHPRTYEIVAVIPA